MRAPTLEDAQVAARRLAPFIRRTPVLEWSRNESASELGLDCPLSFKLELMQATGTFKARGALNSMLAIDKSRLRYGVTAVSAGNHAVAVAYAAKALETSAHVVMIKTANPFRVELARKYGATVELAENGGAAFQRVHEISEKEGRAFIHPFEGQAVVTGTGTVALEWLEQAKGLEALVVAVGGGGLIAGVAAVAKQIQPDIEVFGVEPEGAAVVFESLRLGSPQTLSQIATIADSLAPPMTTPYTFEMCRRYVDKVVLVSDANIRAAMRSSFASLKLAVEPAGAAAMAAAAGPLASVLTGKRVGILICGANIDVDSYERHMRGS